MYYFICIANLWIVATLIGYLMVFIASFYRPGVAMRDTTDQSYAAGVCV